MLSVTGSDIELGNLNPFRYRSYYYDSDIEMYYLQSRYYDPDVCRFINSDDVNFIGATGTVGSYNAFAYCENNPVNRVDYTGCANSLIDNLNKIHAMMFTIMVFLGVIAFVGGTSATLNPAGVVIGVGTGALVTGIVTIYSNYISNVSAKDIAGTKTLADTKARQPKNRPYKLAYVNSKNELIKYGKKLSLKEVLISLGFVNATNSMYQSYRYNFSNSSQAQRSVQHLGRDNDSWGVYAKTQKDAKALALILGCTDPPEVHGSGMYGHYHNSNKSDNYNKHFHIWYGKRITY